MFIISESSSCSEIYFPSLIIVSSSTPHFSREAAEKVSSISASTAELSDPLLQISYMSG